MERGTTGIYDEWSTTSKQQAKLTSDDEKHKERRWIFFASKPLVVRAPDLGGLRWISTRGNI